MCAFRCDYGEIHTLYDIIVTTLPYRQIPPYLTLFYDKVLGFSYQHMGWDAAAEYSYAAVWWVRVCRRRRRNSIGTPGYYALGEYKRD